MYKIYKIDDLSLLKKMFIRSPISFVESRYSSLCASQNYDEIRGLSSSSDVTRAARLERGGERASERVHDEFYIRAGSVRGKQRRAGRNPARRASRVAVLGKADLVGRPTITFHHRSSCRSFFPSSLHPRAIASAIIMFQLPDS